MSTLEVPFTDVFIWTGRRRGSKANTQRDICLAWERMRNGLPQQTCCFHDSKPKPEGTGRGGCWKPMPAEATSGQAYPAALPSG